MRAEADALFMQMPYYAQGSLRTWAEAVKRDALQLAGLGGARLVEVFYELLGSCVTCVLCANMWEQCCCSHLLS